MTFSDQLSMTFLLSLALAALMFVAAPLVPGLMSALQANLIVATSVAAAIGATVTMLAAVLALQR